MFALPAGLEAYLLSPNVKVLLLAGAALAVGAAFRAGRRMTSHSSDATISDVAGLAERGKPEPVLLPPSRQWSRLRDRIAEAQRHADQAAAMQDKASDVLHAVERELGEVASEVAGLMPRIQGKLIPLTQPLAASIRRRRAA